MMLWISKYGALQATSSIPYKTMFALVDCNSFYCSCERIFNPKLHKKPVIVLSNNDGIIIARSDEAKALGIKMGDPYFKVKDLVAKHKVYAFSSNFTLYGDISARVMNILSNMAPELEIYSIDEAFLNLQGIQNPYLFSLNIYHKIMQWTGIPVSVGIGPTKVLAKLANKLAKKNKHISPVCDLSSTETHDEALRNFPVQDIWGIGSKLSAKLNSIGIYTALQLRDADLEDMHKLLTVVGRHIVLELRGYSCLALETIEEDKKQILSSRSFGQPVFSLEKLKESVAFHASIAAKKLRDQNCVCGHLQVFILTNRHKAVTQYYKSGFVNIVPETSSTPDLIHAAHSVLEKIYKPNIEYKKTGVILNHIEKQSRVQLSIFDDKKDYARKKNLMQMMDQINNTFGSYTLQSAACGLKKEWKMRSQNISPCYTTRWKDLLKVP